MTVFVAESLERFADLVLEEAAKVCDKYAAGGAGSDYDIGYLVSATSCAEEIREIKHNVVNIDK